MATKKTDKKSTKKTTTKTTTTKTTKKWSGTTSRKPAPTIKKPPMTVATRTTKPKVVVETKTLKTTPSTLTQQGNKCGDICGGSIGKCILHIFFGLLIITNFILLCVCLNAVKEQQKFTIMSNGGKANYATLKEIFRTENFQLESTQRIQNYYASQN